MFDFKKRREEKKQKNRAFEQAQRWKQNTLLQECLNALRGSCTVALAMNQEAAEAVVNIAAVEGSWTEADAIPADFLAKECYIIWNDGGLPTLCGISALVLEHLADVTAVSFETYLVSAEFDRIVHLDDLGRIRLWPKDWEE